MEYIRNRTRRASYARRVRRVNYAAYARTAVAGPADAAPRTLDDALFRKNLDLRRRLAKEHCRRRDAEATIGKLIDALKHRLDTLQELKKSLQDETAAMKRLFEAQQGSEGSVQDETDPPDDPPEHRTDTPQESHSPPPPDPPRPWPRQTTDAFGIYLHPDIAALVYASGPRLGEHDLSRPSSTAHPSDDDDGGAGVVSSPGPGAGAGAGAGTNPAAAVPGQSTGPGSVRGGKIRKEMPSQRLSHDADADGKTTDRMQMLGLPWRARGDAPFRLPFTKKKPLSQTVAGPHGRRP